jgi:hypothetical protein
MAFQFSVNALNGALNGIEAAVGVAPALEIRSGTVPANCAATDTGTLLASLTLPNDWLTDAANTNKAKSGTWRTEDAVAGGTAGHFRVKAGSTTHMQGTVTGLNGGGDIRLQSTAIEEGQAIEITAFNLGAAGALDPAFLVPGGEPFITGDLVADGTVVFVPATLGGSGPFEREFRVRRGTVSAAGTDVLLDWTSVLSGPISGIENGDYLWLTERTQGASGDVIEIDAVAGFGPMNSEDVSGLIEAPLASIDPLGAFASWDGTPPTDLSGYKITVQSPGFDATGAATTRTREVRPTVRIRQLWPNNASLDASRVALSRSIFVSDIVAGVTNNSTVLSPKPLFAWTVPDRETVGNTIRVRGGAWHVAATGGKLVACVKYLFTDGTNTVSVTVSTPTTRTAARSGMSYIEYDSGSVDITSLNPGRIKVDAEVYPIDGGEASIYKTAELDYVGWEQASLYFRKHVTMAATPVVAFVTNSGDNATGVASTNVATAEANPFSSAANALAAIRTANNSTYGVDGIDGGRLYLKPPFTWASVTTNRQQLISACEVSPPPDYSGRAPFVYSASVNLRMSGKDGAMPDQSLIWRRMSFQPSAGGFTHFTNQTVNIRTWFIDCDFDWTGAGSTGFSASHAPGLVDCSFDGNPPTTGLSSIQKWLGCVGRNMNGTDISCYNTQACDFENAVFVSASSAEHQFILFSTRQAKNNRGGSVAAIQIGDNVTQTRGCIVGNFESEDITGDGRNYINCASGGVESSNHCLFWHVSLAGAACRFNHAYNDVVGTNNRHDNWSIVGYISESWLPYKTDTFTLNTTTGPAFGDYTGNWAAGYGVNNRGNIIGTSPITNFAVMYVGLDGQIPTAGSSDSIDPMFADNLAARASDPTSGGTDFALQTESPGKAKVSDTPLPWTITGAARSLTAADSGAR